jgi:hypothetical protein
MEKENLISLTEKIKQALNAVSVSGYGNLKTLSNCIDALTELEKNINTYEQDVQKMLEKQIKDFTASVLPAEMQEVDGVVPVDPSKPKPQRIEKEVDNSGEN